jgi:hypothetical protein
MSVSTFGGVVVCYEIVPGIHRQEARDVVLFLRAASDGGEGGRGVGMSMGVFFGYAPPELQQHS